MIDEAARAAAYERARQTFHIEAQEMLQQAEQCLLALEEDPDDSERMNALFRAAHTIKGSAGLFGFDALVRFTHVVENVLDGMRAGDPQLTPELSSLLLFCCDHIGLLMQQAREGEGDTDLQGETDELMMRLEPFHRGGQRKQIAPLPADKAESAKATRDPDGVWHISLRFSTECFQAGIDPLATLRYLSSMGELLLVATFDATLPALADLSTDNCYLGFEIRLRTGASKAQLDDAFEFIQDDCVIHLIPPQPDVEHYVQLVEAMPADAERLGDMLVECGAITRQQLHLALSKQHAEAAVSVEPRPLGSILVDDRSVSPKVVDAALKKQKKNRVHAAETQVFRIQAEKLDALINAVGELAIFSSTAKVQAHSKGDPALVETMHQMDRLVEELRDTSLALRMVAIGETFERFRRVVRDICTSLGKSVALEIEGGDTELDKVLVEKIGDPLMHLVRNGLDHGMETPAEREAAGKPGEGKLRLSAYHDAGSIVLEVADNGRGIDPDKILLKARERGLPAAAGNLSREEALNLIFEPGFSTAEAVSDLSGRGVGMDVVRRNIEALRGSVLLDSAVGRGTTIRIQLPLTLAIIDGFLVRAGRSKFVVPLDMIDECIAGAGDTGVAAATGVIHQRGAALPVVDVRRAMGIHEARHELADRDSALSSERGLRPSRRSIVVVRNGGRRAGLLVDQLLGEHQTVIKPIGELFSRLRFVAGSTILGTGEIAFILDVSALLDLAATAPGRAHAGQGPPQLTFG